MKMKWLMLLIFVNTCNSQQYPPDFPLVPDFNDIRQLIKNKRIVVNGLTLHGDNNIINGDSVTLIGNNNNVNGNNANITGNQARVTGKGTSVIGDNAYVVGDSSYVVGNNAITRGKTFSVVTGHNADVIFDKYPTVYGNNAKVTGNSARVTGHNAIVVGQNCSVMGNNLTIYGRDAQVCSDVGNHVVVTGDDLIVNVIYRLQDVRLMTAINRDAFSDSDNTVYVVGENALVQSTSDCLGGAETAGKEHDYVIQVLGKNVVVKIGGEVVRKSRTNQLGDIMYIEGN